MRVQEREKGCTRPSVDGLMSEIIALLKPSRCFVFLLASLSSNFCNWCRGSFQYSFQINSLQRRKHILKYVVNLPCCPKFSLCQDTTKYKLLVKFLQFTEKNKWQFSKYLSAQKEEHLVSKIQQAVAVTFTLRAKYVKCKILYVQFKHWQNLWQHKNLLIYQSKHSYHKTFYRNRTSKLNIYVF